MSDIKSWRENWTHKGHTLNVSSDINYYYLTVKNETQNNNCVAMTYEQFISLAEMLTTAIADLKKDGKLK